MAQREVQEVIEEILRNSSRVNAIVLVWEEWVPIIGDGYACIVRFKPTENQTPHASGTTSTRFSLDR